MLIGLMGKAGSGKDTVADYLVENYRYTKYPLSTPIKKGLAAMLDEPLEAMDDRVTREYPYEGLGKSIREMLQTLGTEWGRDLVHPDIWINMAMRQQCSNLVIPDVRFRNEVDTIRENDGLLIWIQRIDNPYKVPPHPSEDSVSNADADTILFNDRDIDDLQAEVDRYMKVFQARRGG